ncbi:Plastocyanin [Streptomyces sp. 3213]|uniref:cupredoxin domain-containing protein n=1 Tax=Streptomyces sp. 3213.3 TaxID=1855348 RepID=UPI000899D158|nr:plastocyanin/azurin family copper-binding protein [Streptomyces sp. 3213.3]SED73430.1 Plastocyanin [Streptomyces sp. 3213] [Streptomyces sp. 3213.3]
MRAAGRAVPGAAVLALLGLLVLPAGQASAASYHVVMKGYAFSPAALTITAGTTVTWTNEDTAPHDVKTTSGPVAIHSPMLSEGGSWSFTFGTAGSYGYVCTVHPGMTAQLVVKAAAPATSAAPTAHEHGGSSSGSSGSSGSAGAGQRHATVPGRTVAARTPAHSPSPSHAMSTPTAAAAPAPATTAPQAAQVQQTASTSRPLDPLLVLAGLVAGVAVVCLLLVGSRAAQADGGSEAKS